MPQLVVALAVQARRGLPLLQQRLEPVPGHAPLGGLGQGLGLGGQGLLGAVGLPLGLLAGRLVLGAALLGDLHQAVQPGHQALQVADRVGRRPARAAWRSCPGRPSATARPGRWPAGGARSGPPRPSGRRTCAGSRPGPRPGSRPPTRRPASRRRRSGHRRCRPRPPGPKPPVTRPRMPPRFGGPVLPLAGQIAMPVVQWDTIARTVPTGGRPAVRCSVDFRSDPSRVAPECPPGAPRPSPRVTARHPGSPRAAGRHRTPPWRRPARPGARPVRTGGRSSRLDVHALDRDGVLRGAVARAVRDAGLGDALDHVQARGDLAPRVSLGGSCVSW